MSRTQENRILELMRKKPVLRPRELGPHKLSRMALQRLLRKGLVQRVERGLYVLTNASEISEFHSLSEA